MAESFEQLLEVAEVYAAALFALAEEAGQAAEVGAELAELVRLEQAEPGLAAILRSDAINEDQRRASLERMFRGRLSDLVLNTLHVMNAHGRAGLLAALRREYEVHVERAANQVEVRVSSAVALDASQKAEIERWAKQQSGRTPLVEYVVDAAILGGLIVQMGGYRFDYSVRRHLRTVRGQLLERSNRGLNVGVAADG